MRTLSPSQKAKADELSGRIQARLALHPELQATAYVSELGIYLQESETQLIQLMDGQQPSTSDPGNIELGLVLHWLDTEHPHLAELLGLPPTAITSAMLADWDATLEGAGVIYADGTLIAYSEFAQLDPGWFVAVLSYLSLELGVIEKAPFPTDPASVKVPVGTTVTIALTGDWGTGSWPDGHLVCPSQQVIQQIGALQPDFTVHLGDVYYAGTSDEETSHLLESWYAGPRGTFTLNSNHEMYDGAKGYFDTALAAAAFQGQQGTSYFAIHGHTWIVVGLDSAYYDTSSFYMAGAVTDAEQIGFLKGLETDRKQIIVLTHHNPLSTDGTMFVQHDGSLVPEPTDECMWTDVCNALGRAPDYWYCGHIHNGIVYSDQCAVGTATRMRCIGFGALPFGSAYELQSQGSPIPSVDWFANTPLSKTFPNTTLQQQNRVLNGFAVLTVGPNGVQEAIYDQTGECVWSNS